MNSTKAIIATVKSPPSIDRKIQNKIISVMPQPISRFIALPFLKIS